MSTFLLQLQRTAARRALTRCRAYHSSATISSSSSSQHDRLLVVGSGVAGSAAALVAAQHYQIPVTLLFAGNTAQDCNSYWAQGGIIYRGGDEDSPSLLAQDIHTAGAGLCQPDAVSKVAVEGPDVVEQLLLDESGIFAHVPFDRNDSTGQLSLCLEASHSAPRILHHADHTGKLITQHITRAAARHPLITLQSNTVVTDLLVERDTCVGVETLDGNAVKNEFASHGVVLCSGGLGGIYQHSTNPPGFNALGSSVALAERCGVQTQELEFVQFHPTSLNIPNEARFLLTEALRGEGAVLRNSSGERFMAKHHARAELAPRDVVARGVFEESLRGQVYLDITHRDAHWLYQRFPTIQAHLQKRNLDLARDVLPVIPAAHYTCGGISTDLHGKTSLQNLYAAGEAARTGLHGGNRLASTSLLEGLVFGAAVAEAVGTCQDDTARGIVEQMATTSQPQRRACSSTRNQKEASELLSLVRRCMWDHVGVIRTVSGLQTALDELDSLETEAHHLFERAPSPQAAGVRDAAVAGKAVARAAYANRTSVGAHCIVADESLTEAASESDSDEDEVAGMQ